MDLVLEYAARYGGPPRPTDSWALFIQGVRRCARFTARDLYQSLMGPSYAIAGLSSEGVGERQVMRTQLQNLAFGTKASALACGPGR